MALETHIYLQDDLVRSALHVKWSREYSDASDDFAIVVMFDERR